MTDRTYKDKDHVVIRNHASTHNAVIGTVEVREGWDTDLVWIGGSAVTQEPKNIRPLRLGEKVANA